MVLHSCESIRSTCRTQVLKAASVLSPVLAQIYLLFFFFYIPVWVDVSLKTNMLMHSVHTAPHTPISVCILMLPGKCCLHQCRIKMLYCVSQERGQSALSLARSLHFQPEMTGCDVTEFEIVLSVFTKRQVADPGLNFGSPGP